MIGREPELEVLDGEIRRIVSGEFRCCLFEGAAGVGKSRLMEEGLRRHGDTLSILSARSYRLGLTSSFGPWLEAFDRHALANGLPRIRQGVDSDVEQDRGALLETMTSVLDELSRSSPVVVAIDDIHLADASSWEALRYLGRRLHNHPVGVLATARPGGLNSNPLAKDVLMALGDDGALRRVNLRPLNRSEVSNLIQARLQSHPTPATASSTPKALVEWLYERSLGHPLFLLSLLDALLDEGADLAAPQLTRIPTSLRDRVGAELPMLHPDARAVLEVLAVIDRKSTASETAAVLDRPIDEVVNMLDRLHESRLIVEQSDRAGFTYEIAHPLIQEATYDLIGGARRMRLHRKIARVLHEQGHSGPAAAHFARSAQKADDETIEGLCRAIGEAESKGLYREALAILGGLPDLIERGDQRWLGVLDAITWQADWVVDHLAEGDALGAIETMRRIEEVSREASDATAQGIVQFHLASFLAIGAGRLDEAQAACRRAIDLFRKSGERSRELLARNELVWISSCAGELEQAIALARDILSDADEIAEAQVVNQAAGSLVYALSLMGRLEESLSGYELAQRVADAASMTYRRIWGLVQQSLMWSLDGQLDRAVSSIEEATEIDYTMACDALALERLAYIRWLQGDLQACVELIEESGARRAIRGSRRRAWGLALAARALADIGQGTRAERYLEQARETYTGDDILDWSAWCDWSGGYLRWHRGDAREAIALYSKAVGRYREMGAAAVEALVLVDLAEAAFDIADLDLLSRTADRIADISDLVGSRLHRLLADLVSSLSDLAQDRANGELLAHTAEELESLGYLVFAGTAAHHAGACLKPSDRSEAMRMLEMAARLAAASAAVQRRDRSLKLLSEMGAAGQRAAGAVRGPQSLTPREREVATLAARGFTARQIADRLYIGTRTVESHLAHVYPKLGVESKQELVIRGDELGLTETSA